MRSFIYLVGNERFSKLLEDAVYYVRQIQAICRKKGIQLLVVIIPDELQINADLQTEIRKTFYPNLKNDRWNPAFARIVCWQRNSAAWGLIASIYLKPLKGNPNIRPLYRKYDIHWNIAGNQLAADLIQEYLQKQIK